MKLTNWLNDLLSSRRPHSRRTARRSRLSQPVPSYIEALEERMLLSVTSSPTSLEPKDPLGSLIYDTKVSGSIGLVGTTGSDDTDSFTIAIDPEQTITVVVDPDASLQPSVELRDPSNVLIGSDSASSAGSDAVIQTIGSTTVGTYTITVRSVGDLTTGAYTVQLILNAAAEQEGNDSIATAQDVDHIDPSSPPTSFIPLAGTAERGAVLGKITTQYSDFAVVEGFETDDPGNYVNAYYSEQKGGKSNAIVSTAAGHDNDDGDGTDDYGLQDRTNKGLKGWIYRDDAQVLVEQGDIISVWVKSAKTPTGRGYFGFGAGTSGTLSIVVAPDTGQLLLNRNVGYDYEDIGAVSQSWQADHWYRMEVTWEPDGDIIGRLYDSDGTTLLNTVTGKDTTSGITSGGIAFRGISTSQENGFDWHFDTIEVSKPQTPNDEDFYAFTLATGERATLTLKHTGGNADLQLLNSLGEIVAVGAAGPSNVAEVIEFAGGVGGTYYAHVTGDQSVDGVQYDLMVTRGAYFDLENNSGPEPWNGDPVQTIDLDSRAVVLGYIEGRQQERLFAVPISDVNSIVELDPDTGEEINRFPAPEATSWGPDALAYDGYSLFFLNGDGTDTLFELDPDTGAVRDSDKITAGSGNYDGLAAVGGKVYIEDYGNDDILEFDPVSDVAVLAFHVNVNLIGGLAGITGPNALIATQWFGIEVLEIDPTDGTIKHSFNPGGTSNIIGVAVVGGEIYLGREGGGIDIYSRVGDFQRSIASPSFSVSALGGDDIDPGGADFYAVTLATGDVLDLSTLTPGDGTGQFVNDLDPMIRLYDSSGGLVGDNDNDPLGDGHNASLSYTVPAEGSGTYYVEVVASDATKGEYVLTANVVAAPQLPGITVTPISGLETTENGGTDSFTVVLDAEPTTPVTIDLSSSNLLEGELVGAVGTILTLNFDSTNWDEPQIVTVTGVDDDAPDGDTPYTIITAAATGAAEYIGINPADVWVTNLDDDTPVSDPMIDSLDLDPIQVKQGQTLTLTAAVTGSLDSVAFYRDSNGNDTLDVGTDTLLGTDSDSSGGWSVSVGIPGNFATGFYTYFAQGSFSGGTLTDDATPTGEVIKKKGGRPGSSSSTLSASTSTSSADTDTTDATATQDDVLQPVNSASLLGPALTEEEPADQTPTEEDPAILPEDQTDLDSLFGNLDGSLQDELLTV